jgi:hypothetical protein
LEALGGQKKVVFAKKLLTRNVFFVLFAEKVPTCVFDRFGDTFSSVLGSPDPHHSMVFTMYYALPNFSGKVRNMSGKRHQNDSKMGPGGAQGSKHESQNSKIAEKWPPKIIVRGAELWYKFWVATKHEKGLQRGSDPFQTICKLASQGHGEG